MAVITWRAEQVLELAISAIKVGEFERAAHLCVNALKIRPDFAEAFHIRGICLLKQQRPFDALLHFERSLDLKSDQSDAWNNRGLALAEIGLFEEARKSFQQSLSLHPSAEPHITCGGMFAHTMNLPEAEKEFIAALELEPQIQDAHVKLGVIQLGMGKWKEGFENYQWRWYDTPFPPRPYRLFDKWEGQDLTDKTILLYSEQGFGDEIMSLRFVEPIERLAKKVILEVRPTMARLVKKSFPGIDTIMLGDDYPKGIDYSSPLLDIPMVLELTPDTMPKPHIYLSASFEGPWSRLIDRTKLAVGLCWSSGRRPLQPETDKSASAKSIPVELLKKLTDIEDINFYSLQIPREIVPSNMKIIDLTEHIEDFYDTAQFMNELDIIVSVDTSVAHLAGATGSEIINLVRFNGYWPWMDDGIKDESSVWYPSMTVFRQHELGIWDFAINKTREKLIRLAERKQAA